MSHTPPKPSKGSENPSTTSFERAFHANRFYSQLCEDHGIKVLSLQDFDAWKEYVAGEINEAQLNTKAKSELQEIARSFGKYLAVDKKEDPEHLKDDEEKRKRARKANKIYRKVCAEAGLEVAFFQDFASWSDFLEGKISEQEFYERAKLEVQKIKEKIQEST